MESKKIYLTSCGIICEELKTHFYKILNKNVEDAKFLFIKIASEGELDPDTSWIEEEYESILELGINEDNIKTFSYDSDINFQDYDVIYMLGGNTFYLMKKLRECNLISKINDAIDNGVIYIGSSAGSVIMGQSIETSLPYDENWVELQDLSGLAYVDAYVLPHANRKLDFFYSIRKEGKNNIIELYDNYGLVIDGNEGYNYNKPYINS